MVTVAVLAITVTVAVPAFNGLVNGNRLTTGANELLATLQFARSEAIRRNATLRVCPSSDGSSCGGDWRRWIVAVKSSGEVVRTGSVDAPVQVDASASIRSAGAVEFRSDGLARAADGSLLAGALAACLPTRQPAQNLRYVAIASGGGRMVVSRGSSPEECSRPPDAPALEQRT
ncbi:GspH/FimT family pseudopilin [Coralloluteibacterium stylophorae]|uniref:Type II secretion system protein H n=2 Tax=Coralloluteibacterium stylophorae TaxID=1776034 RepID=A0A8J7VU53_9GAMM|nr:GspH/FimT family pseudopilin [Coralloluteibacterium stylophorae]